MLTTEQWRAIDRAKEQLVGAAETLLDDAGVEPSKNFGHSQLRNLVAVAAETESPAVVANFLRYQMGRDNKGHAWSACHTGGESVGDLFLSQIEKNEGAIATALSTVPNLEDDPMARQLARIELIRQFLGFATRYMKYLEVKLKPKNSSGGQGGGAS